MFLGCVCVCVCVYNGITCRQKEGLVEIKSSRQTLKKGRVKEVCVCVCVCERMRGAKISQTLKRIEGQTDRQTE